jgi:hypothetical protein
VNLNGTETDTNPAPDFSEYDKLYGNLMVKEIPEDLQPDKPYTGFANVEGKMYTLGHNSIAQCAYTSEKISITQWNIGFPASLTQIRDLRYNDDMMYIIENNGFLYWYHRNIFEQSQFYYQWQNNTKDVIWLSSTNSFIILSEYYVSGITVNPSSPALSAHSWGATSLTNVDDTILALGNQLTLYRYHFQDGWWITEQVRQYFNISGTSMLKDGDTLIVAGKQGLSFYDISDLKNIKLIP